MDGIFPQHRGWQRPPIRSIFRTPGPWARFLYPGTCLSKITFWPQSRRGRRGTDFLFGGGDRQIKRLLLFHDRTVYSSYGHQRANVEWSKGSRFWSNRRLPIGSEEESPSAISAAQRWNLGSKATNVNPKNQWKQGRPQEIPLNLDSSDPGRQNYSFVGRDVAPYEL